MFLASSVSSFRRTTCHYHLPARGGRRHPSKCGGRPGRPCPTSWSVVEMRGSCDASAVVAVPQGGFDVFLVANDDEQLEAHEPDGTKLKVENGNLRSLLGSRIARVQRS